MLPWPDMMRAALAAGLSPAAFWALSLKEWRWLAGLGPTPMGRRDLAALEAACAAFEQDQGAGHGG